MEVLVFIVMRTMDTETKKNATFLGKVFAAIVGILLVAGFLALAASR